MSCSIASNCSAYILHEMGKKEKNAEVSNRLILDTVRLQDRSDERIIGRLQ